MSGNLRNELFKPYDQFMQWGDDYFYHWFWGVTRIKVMPTAVSSHLLSPKPTVTINQLLFSYENRQTLDVLRFEVENYRHRFFIIRFFIGLFNYNDLHKKNILLAYHDAKASLIQIKNAVEDHMPSSKQTSFPINEKMKNEISEVEMSAQRLGNPVKKMAKKALKALGNSASYVGNGIVNLISGKSKPESELKAQPAETEMKQEEMISEDKVPVYDVKQIESLALFGLSCKIGEYYSKAELKENWRKKALESHIDKGGSDEAFRKIHEARTLLETYANHNQRHKHSAEEGRRYTNKPLTPLYNELVDQNSQCWTDTHNQIHKVKMKNFIKQIAETEDFTIIDKLFSHLTVECDQLIQDYQKACLDNLTHYLNKLQIRYGQLESDQPSENEVLLKKELEDDIKSMSDVFYSIADSSKEMRKSSIQFQQKVRNNDKRMDQIHEDTQKMNTTMQQLNTRMDKLLDKDSSNNDNAHSDDIVEKAKTFLKQNPLKSNSSMAAFSIFPACAKQSMLSKPMDDLDLLNLQRTLDSQSN